jgi:hypothetical protein
MYRLNWLQNAFELARSFFNRCSFPRLIVPSTSSTGVKKAVPLQACSGPEGSRKLGFPDYMTTAQDVGKVVSLKHWPPLLPVNAPGSHFCKRLSRSQCHSAIGRIMSMKISNDTIWNPTSDLPICTSMGINFVIIFSFRLIT